MALESAGFLVFDASDKGRDLDRLRDFWAAFLLLDLPMPRIGGLEILGRRRGCRDEPETIVLMQGAIPDAVAAVRLATVMSRPGR